MVNMQRQAVPLIDPKAPYVGTGINTAKPHDSGAIVIAQYDGKVTYADAGTKVEACREDGSLTTTSKNSGSFKPSRTAYNQRTLVKAGVIIS